MTSPDPFALRWLARGIRTQRPTCPRCMRPVSHLDGTDPAPFDDPALAGDPSHRLTRGVAYSPLRLGHRDLAICKDARDVTNDAPQAGTVQIAPTPAFYDPVVAHVAVAAEA